MNQAGKDILSYEWYQVKRDKKDKSELDKKRVYLGTDTAVSISVPADACIYSYEYYCVVTSRDADERVIQETSDIAMLRTKHNYGDLVASDLYDLKKVKSISIITDDGVRYGPYAQGSEYHNKFCRGEECYHPQQSVGTRHNFVFKRALGHGYNATGAGRPEASREYFYSYLWECSNCKHLELRTSSKELDSTTFEYQITFEKTAGAYAEDGNKFTRITALPGETMYAIAPAKNADGNVFKEWKVVSPGGVTITSSPDGRGEFIMPENHICLKAVYYTGTDSKAATSIEILEGLNMGYRSINGSLTIEAGDEIVLHAKLTPDTGLASDMVVWDVLYYDTSNPQLVFDYPFATTYEDLTTSKPLSAKTKDPKLMSNAPGVVRVRATTLDSGGKVSDTITVKILPRPDVEEPGHEKHIIVGGGTKVQPTCTKSGYTLHKCEFPGCEYQYRNDFVNPLGHDDTDGDGFCDRCQIKMTGTASGNMSMVGLTKINKVEVNVTAPVCGFTPAAAATPTGDDKDLYRVPMITWDPYVKDTETFAGNESYTVLIKLEAKDGYGFKLNGIIDSNNTQFYINGNKATVVYRDAQEASISYTFPATESVHVHNHQWKSDADKHWRECFCGDKIDTAAHTPSDWITDTAATAITAGTKHKECTTCGYVTETGTIPATGVGHTHSFDGAWKSNADKHWKECSCGVKSDSAAHTPSDWITDTAATATTAGTKHKACTTCGYVTETGTIPATGAGHTHSFDSAWKFDADKHWKECSCGTKSETAAHTESARITDTAAGIGTTGAWHTECETCGMQMNSGTIDALEKIDTAEITVTAPVRRGKPEAATTKDSAEVRYHVANTDWDPVVTNRFASGTKYTVKVTLEANDGYGFKLNGLLGIGNTDFFINGKKATVVSGDAQQVIITYQFPATGRASSGGSSGGTTTAQPVKSPGTGDAGIALYAAMGLLSLSGGAWVVGKKRKGK